MKLKIEIEAETRGEVAEILERLLVDIVTGCELSKEGSYNKTLYTMKAEHNQGCLANMACSGVPCCCEVEIPDED